MIQFSFLEILNITKSIMDNAMCSTDIIVVERTFSGFECCLLMEKLCLQMVAKDYTSIAHLKTLATVSKIIYLMKIEVILLIFSRVEGGVRRIRTVNSYEQSCLGLCS